MTRVIAGSAKGRRLAVPRSARPTSDRAREGLFSSVVSLRGGLAGSRVLDLYAGSGALGIEAVSRGAELAVCVESDARAVATIRANVVTSGLPGVHVVRDRVERFLGGEPDAPYDVVFADPPYDLTDEALTRVLTALAGGGWLAPDAVVAVERATRSGEVGWPPGISAVQQRGYGDTTLWYGRAT